MVHLLEHAAKCVHHITISGKKKCEFDMLCNKAGSEINSKEHSKPVVFQQIVLLMNNVEAVAPQRCVCSALVCACVRYANVGNL